MTIRQQGLVTEIRITPVFECVPNAFDAMEMGTFDKRRPMGADDAMAVPDGIPDAIIRWHAT